METSSPTYAQSNGQAERFVQTVKQMFRKAEAENQDPYIALLHYHNAPVSGTSFSPAQMLMSRRLCDKLPTTSKLLKPEVIWPAKQLKERKATQKQYYDRGSHRLPVLKLHDVVRVHRN